MFAVVYLITQPGLQYELVTWRDTATLPWEMQLQKEDYTVFSSISILTPMLFRFSAI